MKFETARESLLKPLQLVYGVVERRQNLPILENFLLAKPEQSPWAKNDAWRDEFELD